MDTLLYLLTSIMSKESEESRAKAGMEIIRVAFALHSLSSLQIPPGATLRD
jgi:hypothetical protein